MGRTDQERREGFTVVRLRKGNNWLQEEFLEGRLRQGWGLRGMSLLTKSGRRDTRVGWEKRYRECMGSEPSKRRFGILSQLTELIRGDLVVVPKVPERGRMTVVRVDGGYFFDETDEDVEDLRHVVSVDGQGARTFDYQSNRDTRLVCDIFSWQGHRAAVSTCRAEEPVRALGRLLGQSTNRGLRSWLGFFARSGG